MRMSVTFTYWDVFMDGVFVKRLHYMGSIGKTIGQLKELHPEATFTTVRGVSCS